MDSNKKNDNDIVRLDVGGVHYTTTTATLTAEPNTMLTAMFSGNFQLKKDEDGRIFIDRDGETFQFILNYLRDKVLLVPYSQESYHLIRLYIDARYFAIENLQVLIEKKLGKDFLEKRLQDISFLPSSHVPTRKVSDQKIFFHGNCSIAIPADLLPDPGSSYTIEAWILPIVHKTNGIIGWGHWGAFLQCNALRLGENNTVVNYWYGLDLSVKAGSLINKWHHIAATHDTQTHKSKIFIDGVVHGELNREEQHDAQKKNAHIGVTNTNEFFIGWIKDIRIWNTTRTAKQIKRNMHNFSLGSPNSSSASSGDAVSEGLKLYLPLDKITKDGKVIELLSQSNLPIQGEYSLKEPPQSADQD